MGDQRQWLCFDGVDWEAQVYLNGELLGNHRVYYQPFCFDVTHKLKQGENTLAVRVIDGREYGEPMTYWATFPDIRAESQRYTPNRAESIKGNRPIGYHVGTGFGIWRDVYLETTGPVRVETIFVRNDLSNGNARIKVELNNIVGRLAKLHVRIMPENCDGQTYKKTMVVDLPAGAAVQELSVPMPGAKLWSPDTPNLYRCRMTVLSNDMKMDVQEVLFGCRSFTLVSKQYPKEGLSEGMFLFNGKPCYLRGTNIQGLNAYAYWGQTDQLINVLLLLKAGHFNAVRVCQHVQMPEVRELLDRLGIMSEQDQGGGYNHKLPTGIRGPQHIHSATVLSRITYNNPGVVLLCFGNEHEFPTTNIVRAGLAVDPQRIFKPISGRFSHSRKIWTLNKELRANAIDDGHTYDGWYGKIKPQTWKYPSPLTTNHGGQGRMVTLSEFGAEALDAYETMKTYPQQFSPPSADSDTLWAASQVQKDDIRQIVGLGRKPIKLAEYIEASQNYQEALLADRMIQIRLLPQNVAGYFHFHFMDVVPVFWPKSIVSHDFRPKKAYYQIAQINQPVVILPRLTGERPDAMTLYACNDLDIPIEGAMVTWSIRRKGRILIEGNKKLDVPPINIAEIETIDLKPVTWQYSDCDLYFTLADADDNVISYYQRHLRCVPKQLLSEDIRKQVKN